LLLFAINLEAHRLLIFFIAKKYSYSRDKLQHILTNARAQVKMMSRSTNMDGSRLIVEYFMLRDKLALLARWLVC